jgi:hypothetical protein
MSSMLITLVSINSVVDLISSSFVELFGSIALSPSPDVVVFYWLLAIFELSFALSSLIEFFSSSVVVVTGSFTAGVAVLLFNTSVLLTLV